jgi:hypothetical protein
MDKNVSRYLTRVKIRVSCNVILTELQNMVLILSNHYNVTRDQLMTNEIDKIVELIKYFETMDKNLKK